MAMPMNGKVKRDLYYNKFRMLDIKKQMDALKIEYKTLQNELNKIIKQEEAREKRDAEIRKNRGKN